MYFHVTSQDILSRKTFVTYITPEPFNILVYCHVFSQVAPSRESLVACVTEERSFSCVVPCMHNQLTIRYPPPTARTAFERTVVRVRLQVYSKVATQCRCVVALATLVGPVLAVFSPDVICQVTFITEPLITYLAGEWFFSRVCS